jgi:hypothetical protein
MRRAILLGLAICLLSAIQARAIVFTDTATFQAQALLPQVGPPINFTSLDSASSNQNRLFTNVLGPGVTGTGVRTVGAVLVTEVTYGTPTGPDGASGILTPDGQHQWVAIFGVEGNVSKVLGGGVFNAAYTTGRIELVQVSTAVALRFKATDPTTWGFNSVNPDGQYSLVGPDLVVPGALPGSGLSTNPNAFPEQVTFLPSFTDLGALNSQIGISSQGAFLFAEDPSHNVLNSDSGQIIPPQFPGPYREGLLVTTDQTVLGITQSYLTPAMQAVLNNIGNWAFSDNFADFGVGGYNDFGVTLHNGFATEGPNGLDFIANLGASAYPTLQAIPEPLSILIWAALGGLGLAWWRVGKRS